MKKQLSVALLLVSAMALQTAALADDEWFHRYDHDKDGHWTYTEFKKAHSDWWKHHRKEARMSDAELHAKFNTFDAEHHGWVTPEQVRTFHEW